MSRRRVISIVLALALIASWVCFSPRLAERLIVEHPLERAEVIFVLSGSAAYKQRTALAAEYFSKGTAPRVALSNDGGRAGWSEAEQTNLPFIELARRELVRGGVPSHAIIQLPEEMTGTQSEATTFAAAAKDLQVRSVLIVTSPYHTRRAFNTFRRVMPDMEIGIVSTPLGHESPNPAWWWLSPAGWRDVGAEYVKSLAYWLFY